MQFCMHCVLFVDQTAVVALVFKPLFLCLWIVWRTVRRRIKAVWSRAGSGEATMQGMEGNLLGRGNCKTNPPQTPQKTKCWGVTVPKWGVTHLKAFFPCSVSLLWGFYTNAYQGRVWMCFFTCFCILLRQLCGSVLIHDPGLKCMLCTLSLEGKWLHVCVRVHSWTNPYCVCCGCSI